MDRHIIYRSQSEAMVDDFWWSEGYFTATKGGDAILIGAAVVLVIFLGVFIYSKASK
jgi:hypothetical protein